MIQIETFSHSQGNPQNKDQVLTLEIVLHFYAPVTPSSTDRGQRKQIMHKEKDTKAIMLYSLKEETQHERHQPLLLIPSAKTINHKKEPRNQIQLPTNCVVFPWSTYTEARAKRGRLGTQT